MVAAFIVGLVGGFIGVLIRRLGERT